MAPVKVTYFNMRGRAEPLRLAAEVAGLDWEDVRVAGKEDWAALKPSTPCAPVEAPACARRPLTRGSPSGAYASLLPCAHPIAAPARARRPLTRRPPSWA